jgi:hypothetical protein
MQTRECRILQQKTICSLMHAVIVLIHATAARALDIPLHVRLGLEMCDLPWIQRKSQPAGKCPVLLNAGTIPGVVGIAPSEGRAGG